MSVKHASEADSLHQALGVVLEGLTFYELAQIVSADTRVKVTFEDLGRRKADQRKRLEELTGPAAKDAALFPNVYPMDAVSRAECYVCGHVVDTRDMPDQCPKCGTARYTFEKEVALTKAWEIAAETSRKSGEALRGLASKSTGKAKELLESLAREDRALADEAGKELAELRS